MPPTRVQTCRHTTLVDTNKEDFGTDTPPTSSLSALRHEDSKRRFLSESNKEKKQWRERRPQARKTIFEWRQKKTTELLPSSRRRDAPLLFNLFLSITLHRRLKSSLALTPANRFFFLLSRLPLDVCPPPRIHRCLCESTQLYARLAICLGLPAETPEQKDVFRNLPFCRYRCSSLLFLFFLLGPRGDLSLCRDSGNTQYEVYICRYPERERQRER